MKFRTIWIPSILSLIIAAAAVKFFPEEIPAHYNAQGIVDRMGSKYEVFIYPAMIVGLSVFWQIFINFFRKKLKNAENEKEIAETQNNLKVLFITAILVLFMQIAFQAFSIYKVFEYTDGEIQKLNFDIFSLTGIIAGIILAVTGNILPKVKRNSIFGLRTAWSMKNDRTWSESNRFCGILLFAGGILAIAVSLVFKNIVVLLAIALIVLAVCIAGVVFSYCACKKYGDDSDV